MQKCLQFTLTSNDLDEVQQLLLKFYEHYERYTWYIKYVIN